MGSDIVFGTPENNKYGKISGTGSITYHMILKAQGHTIAAPKNGHDMNDWLSITHLGLSLHVRLEQKQIISLKESSWSSLKELDQVL